MIKIRQLLLMLVTASLLIWETTTYAEVDVALITAMEGNIIRTAGIATHNLEPFVKLKAGDILHTTKGTRIQITYFENGRQESWSGAGTLTITQTESQATGLPPPQIKQIPLIIVKRLARTPSLDSQDRAGVVRLRSIPSPADIVRLEQTYKEMRTTAAHDDLNPELYLLAGMFEFNQLDRVQEIIDNLKRDQPNNKQAKLLIALYGRALRDKAKSS